MIPQSCLSLEAANQSAAAFGSLAEMALSARSGSSNSTHSAGAAQILGALRL